MHREGVHKRMQGVIWEEQEKDGSWLVLFPRYGEKADIADLCRSRRKILC